MSNVPSAAARSVASERRLRLRRQEARLRLRLLADAALLEAHHASQAPRLPQPARGGGDNDGEASITVHLEVYLQTIHASDRLFFANELALGSAGSN